ncbi:tetratricopeptide repeat protein [Cupriavidus necator]
MMAQNQHSGVVTFIQSTLPNTALSDGDRAWLMFQLGEAYTSAQNYTAAAASYQQSLESNNLSPDLIPSANYGIGNAHLMNENYGAANDYLMRVVRTRSAPQNLQGQSLYALGNLYKKTDSIGSYQAYNRAAQAYEKYLKDGVGDPALEAQARYDLARSLYEFGKTEEAVTAFRTARESGHLDPERTAIAQTMEQYFTGLSLYGSAQPRDSLDPLRFAVDSGNLPKNLASHANYMLGKIHSSMDNADDAEKSFLNAISGVGLSPTQAAEAQFGLGSIYHNSGQYDKAIDPFRTAIDTRLLNERDQAFSHYGLGMSLFNQGRDNAANQALSRALENQNRKFLQPEMITDARIIRRNYEGGRVADAELYGESDPRERLLTILEDIYGIGGKPLDDAGSQRWDEAIDQHLPPETFQVFGTLLERTYSENNKDRGDRNLLAQDMLPVLDRVFHHPDYLEWIASEVQPDSQRACVNQPMAGWSQLAALIDFHDAISGNQSLTEGLTAARALRARDVIPTWVAQLLASERRNANNPHLYNAVEVEVRNEFERKINELRQADGKSKWSGVQEVIPYAASIQSLVTPGNLRDAKQAVERAEAASHDELVEWLTNGPYAAHWQAHVRRMHPDAFANAIELFADRVEAATTEAGRVAIMRGREAAMEEITRNLTRTALNQAPPARPMSRS